MRLVSQIVYFALLFGVIGLVFVLWPSRPPERVIEVSLVQRKPSSPYSETVDIRLNAARTINSRRLDAYLEQLPAAVFDRIEWEGAHDAARALRTHLFSAESLPRSATEKPAITIVYLGDDGGYPVEVVGLYIGLKGFDAGWKVLGARAPASQFGIGVYADRPRARGYALALAAAARKLEEPDASWEDVIAELPIDWVTTNTKDCPAAQALLQEARDKDWFTPKPEREEEPPPSNADVILEPPVMLMHADDVQVSIGGELHEGALWKGSAPGWGAELIDALIPCFQPAAPWR